MEKETQLEISNSTGVKGDEANASLHIAWITEDTEEVTQKDFKPCNISFMRSRKSTEEKPHGL